MLINATQSDELRVAFIDTKTGAPKLDNLDIERTGKSQTKASIFKGIVTRVEPSLEAAFINFGSNRHGFLPIKEVAREYFHEGGSTESGRPHMKDALKPGQEIIVQVDKEERGTKGAALTTFISLAGCYLVLMPNNPRAGGISRRIEGDERDDLKDVLNQLSTPNGMGLIVRTAGVGRSLEELQWDLDVLLTQWQAIQAYAAEHQAPCLIYQDSDVVVRAIRDYLRPEIDEIIVDTESAFERVKKHLNLVRPDFVSCLKLHQKATPLFNSYEVETQIESAFKREVALDNGASIVIDHTEALIAIDINSAKATEGSDIEETALQTNLAAATEIARQLRLRDIGGLIVIDFIDMNVPKHQRMVENRLRDEFKQDRARIQMGRISRFGLMEMSRQRLRPALGETTQITCPRCDGQGNIRSIPSVSMAIIRCIEEEVMKHQTVQINVQVPNEVASFLMNEKRDAIVKLEQLYQVGILIIPNKHFESPHYEYQRIKRDDASQIRKTPSYKQTTQPNLAVAVDTVKTFEQKPEPETITTASMTPKAPTPNSLASKSGLIKRIFKALFHPSEPDKKSHQSRSSKNTKGKGHHQRGQQRKGHSGGGNRQNQQRQGQQRQGQGRHKKNDHRKRHGHNRRNTSKPQSGHDQNRNKDYQNVSTHHQGKPEYQQLDKSATDNSAPTNHHQTYEAPACSKKQDAPAAHAQQVAMKTTPVETHDARAIPSQAKVENTHVQERAPSAPAQVETTHTASIEKSRQEEQQNQQREQSKAKRQAALNRTSFAQLSDDEKRNTFVEPNTATVKEVAASSEPMTQVTSRTSNYTQKPLEVPSISKQQHSSKPVQPSSTVRENENSESHG